MTSKGWCAATSVTVYPDDETIHSTPCRGKKTVQSCYGKIMEEGQVKICNQVLYACINKDDETTGYTPKHIYCYIPLSESLEAILARPGVLDKCN